MKVSIYKRIFLTYRSKQDDMSDFYLFTSFIVCASIFVTVY
ncbi:hypothetical protein SAMN06265348_110165 [Pedobacter westerhofensis]|uniref:Uncharacterized protein n=1 Tax=Pedobacter westerhofensis TaxID=425512 RepID=A0A521F503_9SPHI|nr:hypothetical protein SAMN06265348_110165 [Pedobacter westerhofensis]